MGVDGSNLLAFDAIFMGVSLSRLDPQSGATALSFRFPQTNPNRAPTRRKKGGGYEPFGIPLKETIGHVYFFSGAFHFSFPAYRTRLPHNMDFRVFSGCPPGFPLFWPPKPGNSPQTGHDNTGHRSARNARAATCRSPVNPRRRQLPVVRRHAARGGLARHGVDA